MRWFGVVVSYKIPILVTRVRFPQPAMSLLLSVFRWKRTWFGVVGGTPAPHVDEKLFEQIQDQYAGQCILVFCVQSAKMS